jgi:hypothetical protein
MSGGLGAKLREYIGRVRCLEPAARGEPQWHREMAECDHWFQSMPVTALQNLCVMIEFSVRIAALAGLYAGPLDTEAVAVEAKFGGERDVFGISVVAVTSVPGSLLEERGMDVFHQPAIAVAVIAFALMSRNGGAPKELRRSRDTIHYGARRSFERPAEAECCAGDQVATRYSQDVGLPESMDTGIIRFGCLVRQRASRAPQPLES